MRGPGGGEQKTQENCRCPSYFHNEKLKTALPSLKSKVPTTLLSHVVYHIKCPGCNSSYARQTTRHLATRLQEHSRASSHVGTHLLNCGQTMENASVEVLERSKLPSKLLTLEALHISRRQRALI